MQTLELIHDEASQTVRIRLPADTSDIKPQDIVNALAERGFARFTIHNDTILTALSNPEQSDTLIIAQGSDAKLELAIDADAMSAKLTITPAAGGRHATEGGCLVVLKNANIIFGVDETAIEALVHEAREAADPVTRIVARGSHPTDGEDSSFTALVTTLKDRILKPSERADGSVDYHDLGDIPMVRAGTPLMRRSPPDGGINGTNIHAIPVPAAPGNVVPFNRGNGTAISPGDDDVLVATLDGMPVAIEKGMSVEKVYKVKSVGISTGNIKFDGNVVVEADVTTGFSVFGSGDVTINGVTESAEVTAGNDIFIKGGVSGNLAGLATADSARIHAGNTLFASFAQFAEVHAKNGIICSNFVLNSNLISQDWVKLGGDKPAKSKVMGGTVRAKNLLKVDIAGSPNEVHTRLELHFDQAAFRDHKHQLETLIREREQQLVSVERLAQQVRENAFLPNHQELVKRGEQVKRKVMDEIAVAAGKLRKLESDRRDWSQKAKIVICRKAYPGTEIVIGERRLTLTEEWGPGTISYGEEGLLFNRGKI